MNVIRLRTIFNEIAAKGGNDKLNEFSKHKEDLDLLEVVDFCMNPRFKTGLKLAKLSKELGKINKLTILNSIKEMMDYLRENNTGNSDVVASIQSFMNNQILEEDKTFILQVATQSLKWELGVSSVNNIMGYMFIPQHKIVKPEKITDKHIAWLKKNKLEIAIYKKEEGYREEIKIKDGISKIYSSSGALQNPRGSEWVNVEAELSKIDNYGTLSAEVIKMNDPINPKDRMTLFNETGSTIRRTGQTNDVEIFVFDYTPTNMFDNGIGDITLRERKDLAKEIVDKINSPIIHFIEPMYQGFDYDMINECFNEICSSKGEGIVICVLDSTYEGKKTYKQMMKMKTGEECDLKLVGFEQGAKGNKYENTLGSLIIEFKGHEVKCSLGIRDLYNPDKYDDRLVREYIWSHREELLGSIVRVGYMDIIKSKGNIDLRYCTLLAFRDDKTEESYD